MSHLLGWAAYGSLALNIIFVVVIDQYRGWIRDVKLDRFHAIRDRDAANAERDRYFTALMAKQTKPAKAPKRRSKGAQ